MKYNEAKAAQMAAYFLHRRGGRMSYLKLMKLLYLADRLSIQEIGLPISGDHAVSMEHGPVLSTTLNHLIGSIDTSPGGWNAWVGEPEGYEVPLRREVATEDLSDLSEAELDMLSRTWERFGHLGRFQIRDYTHYELPEWEDPSGSSWPISYKNILLATGWSEEAAKEMVQEMAAEEELDKVLEAL